MNPLLMILGSWLAVAILGAPLVGRFVGLASTHVRDDRIRLSQASRDAGDVWHGETRRSPGEQPPQPTAPSRPRARMATPAEG